MRLYWYNSSATEASYLLIHKNGSTSIRNAMGHTHKAKKPNARAFTKLRNPYERAVSIYNEMVRQREFIGSFESWLESKLEHGFSNEHEYAQSYWLDWARMDTPQIRLFTTFEDVSKFLDRPIKRLNPSEGRSLTSAEMDMIEELYADDIKLWNRVKALQE